MTLEWRPEKVNEQAMKELEKGDFQGKGTAYEKVFLMFITINVYKIYSYMLQKML